jgi:alpha-galactosidase
MNGIERYKLDLFRLDYNLEAHEGGFNIVDGQSENTLWRHVEVIYQIFDRVRQKFPDVMLENCSSGGGRTDIGIMSRFDTTWTSDWMMLPRTVRILNGMSMVLPPEYVSRAIGMGSTTDKGSFDTLMHVVIMGHPCLIGLTPNLAEANPELMKRAKKYISIYKYFIRTFHREARVYHHTPVISGADGTGWAALEYVSQDRKKAVAAVFRLLKAEQDTYRLRFRGLDPSLDYRITIEPGGLSFEEDGSDLMNEGWEIRLDTALTSKLLLIEAQ